MKGSRKRKKKKEHKIALKRRETKWMKPWDLRTFLNLDQFMEQEWRNR